MIELMTVEQTKEIIREELKRYFTENPVIVQQIPHEPKIVDLDRLIELRPIVGAKSTIYKKASAGTIPHSKQGKRLFFRLSEIDEWLLSGRGNKAKSVKQIEEEMTSFLEKKMRNA